jgi:hypothetical protein
MVILITLFLAPLAITATAQGCSICTKTSGELGGKQARGLNSGILYLAAVPLTLLGTIGFIWWRHNKNE